MTRARSVFSREANATRDADLRRQRQLERQELGRLPRGATADRDEDDNHDAPDRAPPGYARSER